MVTRTRVLAAALTTLVAGTGLANLASASVYDFEGLSAGALAGQDNWKKINPAYNAGVVGTGAGVNPTKVGAGSAETNAGQPTGVSRINNGIWNYTVNFSDTASVFQVDRRWGGSDYLTYGNDSNSNGTIEWDANEEPGWLFSGGDIEIQTSSLLGSWVASTSIPASTNAGDWVRIAYVADWTAGSFGTMSVSMMNLTDGETVFQPVAGLQNVALGTTWGTWRTNMLANPARAGIILLVDNGALTNSDFDNITIVPEPASLSLIGLGGLLMVRRRKN